MAGFDDTTSFYRKRLPHWEVKDGKYFVTILLHGAIPAEFARRIREMTQQVEAAPKDPTLALQRQIFRDLESRLDQGEGPRHLANEQVARMVMEAIRHRQQKGTWSVYEYVLMPNHIHLFLQPEQDSLKDVLEAFRKWTGHQATRILKADGQRFWHREWFDRWSRNALEDQRIVTYIRNNPVKAGLVEDYRNWPFASWAE